MKSFSVSLFGGYSKHEVDAEIENLSRRIADLEQKARQEEEKARREEENARELKLTVRKYQERESFIGEALVDARRLSENLISGSRETAEEAAQNIVKEAEERLKVVEEAVANLNNLESVLGNYENTIKDELRGILHQYLADVEQMSFVQLKEMQEQVSNVTAPLKEELEKTKEIVAGVEEEEPEQEDEVPTYMF